MKSIRFQRILVALDQSVESDFVFDKALTIARNDQGSLILAHCLEFESLANDPAQRESSSRRSQSSNTRSSPNSLSSQIGEVYHWLGHYAHRAQVHDIQTELICQIGDVGFRLCQLADCWKTDLLVLGHGGQTAEPGRYFGSVARHALLYAPCSVMAVHQKLPLIEPVELKRPVSPELNAFATQVGLPFPRHNPQLAQLMMLKGESLTDN